MEVKNYCSWRNFCDLNRWSTQPTLNGHELIGTIGQMKMASSKSEGCLFGLWKKKRHQSGCIAAPGVDVVQAWIFCGEIC